MNDAELGVPVINIVVPCYNEEEVLPETARRLSDLIDRMIAAGQVAAGTGVYFVDDGSRDNTWQIVAGLHAARPDRFHGIKLSRNQGHQAALLAGLRNTPGDALISIDADLQDDIETIIAMVSKFREGHDIVYGVRSSRDTDTVFKRRTARAYYDLLRWLGVDMIPDHADFRLMSRRAVAAMERYSEVNLYIRAIVPMLGFRTAQVYYERHARFAGVSKYPMGKMLALAINGITSFSMRPLRMVTVMGLAMALLSFMFGLWALGVALFSDRAIPGWTSTVVPIMFVGALEMLALGIIGEYIGKIYLEVKRRPLFEVDEII
jgi:glycosyltransferase involved in cell wall biosynthesis